MFAFTYFTELVHAFALENQSNPTLFRLLQASLKAGENNAPIQPLVRYFEVWCLKISGVYPNYDYCSRCGRYVKEESFWVRIKDAAACCDACAPRNGILIGAAAAGVLRAIMRRSPEDFASIAFDTTAGHQLEQLTQALLRLNLDSPVKSYRILKEALINESEV
jgi:DNA repair protein RecO